MLDNVDPYFVMDTAESFFQTQDQIIFAVITFFMELVSPSTDFQPQPETVHHHNVSGSKLVVQGDTAFIRWYKMMSLYFIWGWVSYSCPIFGLVFLFLTNDGGVFYNECYYMFYNGVVWYNPPKPYEPKQKEEKIKE